MQHSPRTVGYRFCLPSGKVVVHVADGCHSVQNRSLLPILQNADLLIHDAQYCLQDFKPNWGHSAFEKVVELALAAGVKRLVLFHHGPTVTDRELKKRLRFAKQKIRRKGSSMLCELAKEGKGIAL